MTDPRAQDQYQVRFAIGSAGLEELADADILLVADELGDASDPTRVTIAGAPDAAGRVLAEQERRGARVSVAVVARGRDDASVSVPDLLAAGAAIDALAEVGLDHCSPEAATAAAAFTGLRRATTHLVRASVASRIRESGARSGR